MRRHALSKWCRVIEIALEVSRLAMSLADNSVMHEGRAGLGGLRNEHAERAIEIWTFRQ